MRCDIIAEGIIAAVQELGLKIPLIVRLQGTQVEAAKKLIEESGLPIISIDDLDKAANKVVNMAKIVKMARDGGFNVRFESQ